MKNKFVNIFSPSKNWKTTLYLVVIAFVLTLGLSIFMGFQFNTINGDSKTFWLIAKHEDSLGYIRYIFEHNRWEEGVELFLAPQKPLDQSVQLFSTIVDWLLISLLIWFVVIIGFVINHFRFINIIGKTRRVTNASIILICSLILLILVFLYWVAYFQAIPVLMNKNYLYTDQWNPSWQTIVQLTIILIVVTMVVVMSSYNVFVESKTVYVSISKKYEIENEVQDKTEVQVDITAEEEVTSNEITTEEEVQTENSIENQIEDKTKTEK